MNLVCTLLCSAAVSVAQTTGDIAGTVTEPSGLALRGVTVESSSPSLQGTRMAVTGPEGAYRFPGLPPGLYRIRATLERFGPGEKTATVSLDSTATVNFTLQVAAREEILVSGEIPLVDVTSTTTGTNYVNKVIVRLPVARNYADIVRANPGVNTDQGETQGRSLALTIYGASSVENQWIVDGTNTTNVIKGMQGKAINNEFIQEVEVKTGAYQAEYGRALGGIINVITKSGGNEFHGDGFLYYDSFDWRARQQITDQDSITNVMQVADYKRTDFGADFGGFFLKDRLWFFGAYDRVQTPAKVSRYISSVLVPNTLKFPLDSTDSLYSGKLTWNAAVGTTFVATVFADPTTNSGAGAADPRQGKFATRVISNPDPGTWSADRHIGGTDYSLRASQLFGSTSLFSLQASRHEDSYELKPVEDAAVPQLSDRTCTGGTPEEPCEIPNSDNFVTGGFGAVSGARNRNTSTRDQLRGDMNLYLGSHELKLGGDYQDARSHAANSFSGGQRVTRYNERGQTYYRHDFFAASPTDLTAVDNVVNPRTIDAGAYAQDSWRALPGLTVNAGLRWDQEDIRDYRNVSVIKTKAEWQPRLGVVWDPERDGKMKLYAFAGRFYYALPTDLSVLVYGARTFAQTYNFDPVSLVQDPGVLGGQLHERAGGRRLEGDLSGRIHARRREIARSDVLGRVEGDLPAPRPGHRRPLRPGLHAARDRLQRLRDRQSRLQRPVRPRRLPRLQRTGRRRFSVFRNEPRDAARDQDLPGHRDRRPQVLQREVLAPGFLSVFLGPRQLRRGGEPDLRRADRSRHQRRLRLSGVFPQQFGPPVPGPPAQRALRRLLRDPLEALGRAAGLSSVRPSAVADRILQCLVPRHPVGPEGLRRETSDRLGGQPHVGLSALARTRDRDRPGLRLQPLQQPDPDVSGHGLVHAAARRLPGVPLRLEPGAEQPGVRKGHEPPGAALGPRRDPDLVLSLEAGR